MNYPESRLFLSIGVNMRALAALSTALFASGCASQLVVHDSTGRELPGFPVPTAVSFQETGEFTQLSKGGPCSRVSFVRDVTLPVGPPVYVNVSAAQFAKTALALKFTSAGTIQELSMNTEPSGQEVLKAATEAFKTVAPLVGSAAQAPPSGQDATLPLCDAGPDPATFKRLPHS